MKRAAIFFDRDNTLIANDGYLGDPRGVSLVDGAANAIARARTLGYAVVVFSNQSGVARGMFSEEAVHAVNQRLDEMLLDENAHAVIDRHEFCPYHPEATVERYRQDSDLRKPRPGMILQAERQLALDLPRSWVIGDAGRDVDAGRAAGCRTILLKNGSLPESPDSVLASEAKPDYEVESLAEALEVIARHPAPNEPAAEAAAPPEESREESTGAGPSLQAEPPVVSIPMNMDPSVPAEDAPASLVLPPSEPLVPDEPQPPLRIATEAPTAETPSAASTDADDDEPEIPRGRSRTEMLLGQILEELRRRHERPEEDFSVSKLLAGVVQVLALAAMFYAYLNKSGGPGVPIAVGIFLQVFTIALLIMGRQK